MPAFDAPNPNHAAALRPEPALRTAPRAADPPADAPRVKTRDLAVATRQLATLLRAGLPLVPALAALVEQLRHHPFGEVIRDLHQRVSSGAALADALERHPDVFPNLYANMVRAGEAGGALEEVLLRLADLLENRARLTARLKAAFAYPCLMAVVAVGVIVFLLTFVVPTLAQIFADMKRDLPWPTTVLIAVSTFLRRAALLLALALAGLVLLLTTYLRSAPGRRAAHRAILHLPVLGRLVVKLEAARLTRTFGALLASGLSVLDAFRIAGGIVQNRHVAQRLQSVAQDIQRGDTVAQALRRTGLFEPILLHTVRIGEMSGNLDQQLLHLADACDEDLENLARSATALLEPAILLLMGALVGFIVLAILLPIFEINQML